VLDQSGNTILKELEEVGGIDMVVYDPLECLIDPLANPVDIQNTAEYVIVRRGESSKEAMMALAESEGWDFKGSELNVIPAWNEDDLMANRKKLLRRKDGMTDYDMLKKYVIDIIYRKSGQREVYVNEKYKVDSSINNKMVMDRLPVVIFTPFTGDTVYGSTIYETTLNSRKAKSTIVNLIVDSAIRNLTSPTYTTSQAVVNRMATGKVLPNEMIAVEDGMNRSVHELFFRPQIADFTNGLNVVLNTIQQDIEKSSPIAAISQGIQTKQIRTNSVLEEMQSKTNRSIGSLTNNVELNFFVPLAKDLLCVLAGYFFKFNFNKDEISQDDLLNSYKTMRIRNGSSLTEDKVSRLEAVSGLLEEAKVSPEAFDVMDILEEKYSLLGMDDVETFFSDAESMQSKINAKTNVPVNLGKGAVASMMG
jgi:hypothetical protein